MLLIDRILGSRLDPSLADDLHHLEHHGAVDVVTIATADLARRRMRINSQQGADVAIALARDQRLFDGAVLLLEETRALLVRVEGERWLTLAPRDPAAALELGYHAGNLHWRVRFQGSSLQVALEGPVEAYVARLGDLVGEGRVTVTSEPAP